MLSYKRNVFWNVIFNYTPIVFALFTGLFFVPLYLENIPKNLYGAWLATGNVLALLTIFDPGFNILLQQRIAVNAGADNKSVVGKFIFSGILLALIISFLILLFGVTFLYGFKPSFGLNIGNQLEEYNNSFLIGLFGTSLMVFSYTFSSINQGLMSSFYVGIIYLFSSLFAILISYVLLTNEYGLISLAIVSFVSGLLLSLGNILFLIYSVKTKKLTLKWDKDNFTSILKISTSSFFVKALNMLSLNLDLLIVSKYLNSSIVTDLSITKKVPELSKSLIERPSVSIMPAFGHMFGAGNSFENLKRVSLFFNYSVIWISGLVFTLVFILERSFISLWVGESFFLGNSILLLLCINYIVQLLISIANNLTLSINECFIYLNKLVIFQSIMSVFFMILGFSYFGITGLFVSQILTGLIFLSFYLKKMISTYEYAYSDLILIVKEVLITFLITLATYIISYFFTFNSWTSLVIFGVLFFIFFLIFI